MLICIRALELSGFVRWFVSELWLGFVHGFELQLELMLELAHELGAL